MQFVYWMICTYFRRVIYTTDSGVSGSIIFYSVHLLSWQSVSSFVYFLFVSPLSGDCGG